jgi:hypothetical protein
LYIPANNGNTVQLHTASMVPDTAATEYEIYFGASAPKSFNTDSLENSDAIAPAKKNAGTKHMRT